MAVVPWRANTYFDTRFREQPMKRPDNSDGDKTSAGRAKEREYGCETRRSLKALAPAEPRCWIFQSC
jgi:hypothetical protein